MTGQPQNPIIRQDLSLTKTEANPDGSPAWILHDDLSGRYFRLGRRQMELLVYVDGRDAQAIADHYSRDAGETISTEVVTSLFDFLRFNNLVKVDQTQEVWIDQQRQRKTTALAHMAKTYLFFRIPLFRPDKFLTRTLPLVAWLGSAWALKALLFCGLLGVFLVLREFDSFKATFLYFFNVQGLVYFATALIFVKVMHELGHGYTAKYYGCKVPIIGVAFLVLWPVLYTDTSDAWRVVSRKHRLRIDGAGIAVELGVAALALLAWSLAPEGPIRSVLFILATSTWLVSLAVNLNPLMRFDGYYLLSDYWRMPNLEPRSQALARWWLREALFGFGEVPPENPRGSLIIFAMAVWVYRFLLFLGIALLVYHLFFKVLGILLFIVEIIYFILGPIFREVLQWLQRKQALRWNRATMRTSLGAIGVAVLLFFPWNSTVNMPAILQAGYQVMYAPADGRLSEILVASGSEVEPGQALFVVDSPELNYDLAQAQRRYDELQWQRESLGVDDDILSRSLITATEMETQRQRLNSLQVKRDRLSVLAPAGGRVTDTNPTLREEMWLGEGEMIFALAGTSAAELFAYADETRLSKIEAGQQGTFYPDGGGRDPLAVEVVEVDYFGVQQMEQLYSASVFGGGIAVRETEDGRLIPAEATYRLRLKPLGEVPNDRVLRGSINLQVPASSLAARGSQWLMSSLIRESGF